MKSIRRFVGVLVSASLLCAAGCGRSPAPQASDRAGTSFRELDLVHDFGRVIEGTKVEHTFSIRNESPFPIAIADDDDVRKTCGCSTLDPSTRRLQPGQFATIRMRVDTTGKNGPFRVGGLIQWRTDDGEAWPLNLYLEGIAKTILATQPGLIQFSADDVTGQNCKELRVFNSLDVDWSTMCVDIAPAYAEVVKKTIHEDHVTLLLRPCRPEGVLDFSARLQLTADLMNKDGPVTHCAVAVPLQGVQRIDLQVSPRVVFARWSPDAKKATARFLVRRLASGAADSISSISCDGFRTTWATKDLPVENATAYHTFQIEVNLSDPVDPSFAVTLARHVRIAFSGGRSVEVPVYFVAHQERS